MAGVSLGTTGIETSRIGLGAGELFRITGAGARRRLLDAAFDGGIRHFDVAPMYGFGAAEGEVGAFAKGRRDDVVIVTKFGITPTPAARALVTVQGPVREALARVPKLRARAREDSSAPGEGRLGSLLYRAGLFDVASAARSLDRSLRRLGTDHVDLLLVHEASVEQVDPPALRAFLEQAQRSGRIRAWGVSGEPERVGPLLSAFGAPTPVAQTRLPGLDAEVSAGPVAAAAARIVFGAVGPTLGAVTSYLQADPERVRSFSERLGIDLAARAGVADALLRFALARNADGVVLVGSTRPAHLLDAVRASAEPFDSSAVLSAVPELVARAMSADAVETK